MQNPIQFLLAVAMVGYILIEHWENLPLLAATALQERGTPLLVWFHLYVASSAFLAMLLHSNKSQFFPLSGWKLGVVWAAHVTVTFTVIAVTQFFLFILTPDGILISVVVNIVGGAAGILLGNLVLIGYNFVTTMLGTFWNSTKNPFLFEIKMLKICAIRELIPPTDRATKWPAKWVISLMVGYETIMDWGWL